MARTKSQKAWDTKTVRWKGTVAEAEEYAAQLASNTEEYRPSWEQSRAEMSQARLRQVYFQNIFPYLSAVNIADAPEIALVDKLVSLHSMIGVGALGTTFLCHAVGLPSFSMALTDADVGVAVLFLLNAGLPKECENKPLADLCDSRNLVLWELHTFKSILDVASLLYTAANPGSTMDGPLLEKVKEAILEVFHFGDANPSLVTKPGSNCTKFANASDALHEHFTTPGDCEQFKNNFYKWNGCVVQMLHEYMQISQHLRLLRLSKPAHMAVAAEPSSSALMALSVAHATQFCRVQLESDIDGGDLRVASMFDERDSAREAYIESTSTRVDVSMHLVGMCANKPSQWYRLIGNSISIQ